MWSGLFPAVNENEGLRKMELLRLKDKVIVVSGGTKGVGRTISEVCGREGAKIVIGGRDERWARKGFLSIRI